MHKLRSRLTVVVGVLGAAAMIAASPAAATTGSGTVVGQGTIAPGFTQVPRAQTSVTFVASLVVATAPSGSGTYNCSFMGDSDGNLETLSSGKGSVTGSCAGTGVTVGTISCPVIRYVRTANVFTIDGNCSGAVSGHITGALLFEPTSLPVMRSYLLQGEVVIGV